MKSRERVRGREGEEGKGRKGGGLLGPVGHLRRFYWPCRVSQDSKVDARLILAVVLQEVLYF